MSNDTSRERRVRVPPPRAQSTSTDALDGTEDPDLRNHEESSPRISLDVSGFTSPHPDVEDPPTGDEPGTRSMPPSRPRTTRRPKSGEGAGKRKTTVQLPHRLIDSLRELGERTDETHAEIITQAYVGHGDDLETDLVDTQAAQRRAELGLPPPEPPRPASLIAGEPRGQLGLYVRDEVLRVLDRTAQNLGISRSHLIEELLDRHLATRH